MPKKLYPVSLTDDQRADLRERIRCGLPGRELARARILLWADEGLRDADIAERLEVSTSTVERIRRRCHDEGLDAALTEKPRPGSAATLDGKAEALLIELACSKPPEGQARWTLRQLGAKLVALDVVESVSHETVRRVVKKANSSRGRSGRGASRR